MNKKDFYSSVSAVFDLWYWDILGQKIIPENLVQFKNLYEFYRFLMCDFFGPKCPNTPKSYTTGPPRMEVYYQTKFIYLFYGLSE